MPSEAGTAGERSRVLVVVAHPDDETFGLGSVIAGAADQGAELVVCCATRGEAGQTHVPLPEGADLATVREAELRAAGDILGVADYVVLDFGDSGMEGAASPTSLAGAPLADVVEAVRRVVDQVRPTIVVTLDPVRSDGHRDHERIGAATLAAVADRPGTAAYVWCIPRTVLAQWFAHLATLRPDAAHLVDVPAEMGRPDDEVTTVLDSRPYKGVRALATAAHATPTPPFAGMPAELEDLFLSTDHLVRVQPPWPGGDVERRLPL